MDSTGLPLNKKNFQIYINEIVYVIKIEKRSKLNSNFDVRIGYPLLIVFMKLDRVVGGHPGWCRRVEESRRGALDAGSFDPRPKVLCN